jgi:hypothetical protein
MVMGVGKAILVMGVVIEGRRFFHSTEEEKEILSGFRIVCC